MASLLLGRSNATGYLFLGPGPVSLDGSEQYGPLITDRRGEPVWFRPVAPGLEVTNFTSASYNGQPVLIWWEGKVLTTGYGQGEAVIVDRGYRELARVRAAGGRSMDMHALQLTSRGTALFTCYPEVVPTDLSPIGGPKRGHAVQSIIQEVDVASGRLLFEWQSHQHVSVEESYEPVAEPYDYLHANAIDEAPDGNLLVSARHTWALYKLERGTGRVLWRLGGRRSSFQIGPGAGFAWQHDAQHVSDRLLTVFDNSSNGPTKTKNESRGLLLDVDEAHRTVALRKAYTSPQHPLASSMGSVQILPSDRVVVGWGTAATTSEFAADGTLLLNASLPSGMYSYHGLWLDWRSAPAHLPAIAADGDKSTGAKLVYASWNGATRARDWRIDAGPTSDGLRPVGIARRRGFETIIPLHAAHRYASVTALDRSGRPLARSRTIRL